MINQDCFLCNQNPYERVFMIYINHIMRGVIPKKQHLEIYRTNFNNWVQKILVGEKLVVRVDEFTKLPDGGSIFFHKTKFINQTHLNFDDMYDFQSAKLVYVLYKKYFFSCNYNPFSFTKKELSNDDKIRFLHEIL